MMLPSSEFVTTNGIGGYSSSSIIGANTRKYHGLLVSSDSKLNRFVKVSTLHEKVKLPDATFDLTTSYFKDNTIHPHGYRYLENFSDFPIPTFEYKFEDIKVTKQIAMLDGYNATIVKYIFESPALLNFNVKPLITSRNIYDLSTIKELQAISLVDVQKDSVCTQDKLNKFTLIKFPHANYHQRIDYYYDFHYSKDEEEGNECRETLLKAGEFDLEIPAGKSEYYLFMADGESVSDLNEVYAKINFERLFEFDKSINTRTHHKRRYSHLLWHAAKFVVSVEGRDTILSGYHWFKDFGRDAFISFRGLLLLTKRFEEAKNLLLNWKDSIHDGLVPNILHADNYNSIDASLWYIDAVWQYYKATNDIQLVQEVYPKIKEILIAYVTGTKYGIKLYPDGTLRYTQEDQALTWMDAKVDNQPVIDRSGAAVEIQALWFNALHIIQKFTQLVGNNDVELICRDKIDLLKKNFLNIFRSKSFHYLYDVVKENGFVDYSIRPNQLFALSLDFPLVTSPATSRRILTVVEDELLTPVGLRTLSPQDPKYKPHYTGEMRMRDGAYHQGTIWPWLYGAYVKAYLKSYSYSESSRRKCSLILGNFFERMKEDNLYEYPEIYDASDFTPKGCVAQAWTVAQLLEAMYEVGKTQK